jgi:predicted alpha/beta hydrolase family esterase
MPDEDDPSFAKWSAVIRSEMADLDAGAVVVGHSVGAIILIKALAEQPPARELAGIVLIAPPFVGEGGWASEDFALSSDLGATLRHNSCKFPARPHSLPDSRGLARAN